MGNNTGREISKENRGPTCWVSSKAMAKKIKYSVSRLTTAVIGLRHKYKYQRSSNIGINEKANDESIVAIVKTITTYIFRKVIIPRLYRLIISLI